MYIDYSLITLIYILDAKHVHLLNALYQTCTHLETSTYAEANLIHIIPKCLKKKYWLIINIMYGLVL